MMYLVKVHREALAHKVGLEKTDFMNMVEAKYSIKETFKKGLDWLRRHFKPIAKAGVTAFLALSIFSAGAETADAAEDEDVSEEVETSTLPDDVGDFAAQYSQVMENAGKDVGLDLTVDVSAKKISTGNYSVEIKLTHRGVNFDDGKSKDTDTAILKILKIDAGQTFSASQIKLLLKKGHDQTLDPIFEEMILQIYNSWAKQIGKSKRTEID